MRATCSDHLIFFDLVTKGMQNTNFLIVHFPSVSCYFVLLRPKCLPQHTTFSLPSAHFLPIKRQANTVCNLSLYRIHTKKARIQK
jgi:hypothetical protein